METEKPDFEALRAARNKAVQEHLQKLADEEGIPVESLRTNFNPSACYCDCPEGPCEHVWDGPAYENESVSSATCSRCGMTAFSHDMRVAP